MKRNLAVFVVFVMSLAIIVPCSAIGANQETAIVGHCEEIRDHLKIVQKDDARVRVHLGGRYEAILQKFITPLNVRLVENNLSSADFVENQNDFVGTRKLFNNDYINYQQELEELVAIDCKHDPSGFYEKLGKVRQKRRIVGQDVLKMRNIISKHVQLVAELKGKV